MTGRTIALGCSARPVFCEAQRFVGGPWTAGQHRQRGFVPL